MTQSARDSHDSTVEFDPFEVDADIPHDAHRALRSSCPVAQIPVGWFLARHGDVVTGVKDVDTFRSSYREPGVVVLDEEQLVSEMPEPRHGKVRRIINAVVAHHKAMRLEPFVRELSYEYLEPLLD